MNKISPALLLITTLIPLHVFASQPDFNYLEINAGQSKMESVDHDTFSLNGNFGLTENFYLSAEFESFDHKEYRGADFYYLGAGYVFSLNETSNLFTQLDYSHREMVSEYDKSLSGYRLTLGYRNQLNSALEGYAKVAFSSLESNGSEYDSREKDSLMMIGMKYNITSTFAGIAELNENGFKLGLRVEF